MTHRKPWIRSATTPLVAMFLMGGSATAVFAEPYRDQWHPTTLEIARLPRYCQGQFIPGLKGKPGFRIDGCGTYMNHFCPGLVLINRASDSSRPKSQRREVVREARVEIDYTRGFLPKNCPIEAEISAAEARVRFLEMTVK